DTGTSHVLAVSGMHLAAVALLLYALVRRAWAALPLVARRIEPARAAAAMGALAAVAYAMVTGASPSVVRALWVVLVFFAGVLLDRRARLVDALGLAAVLVLVERPSAIFDVSVQLSFAATLALGLAVRCRAAAVAAPPRAPGSRAPAAALTIARRLRGAAATAVVAALWTSAATAPILAHHFGEVAIAGPVASLVSVPAVELFALPVGLLGALVGELWPAG